MGILFFDVKLCYSPIFDSLNARKASKQALSSHFIMSKSVAISNYFLGDYGMVHIYPSEA